MAKSSFTRREFLKVSALSSSAFALGACSSFDRLFMGDKRNLTSEVAILGAGAAGLAAAYSLKKKKIPFRIFEASSRVGGRVQTVKLFPDQGPVAELGAEFFEEDHQSIFTLAKDLNIPVREVKAISGLEPHLFSFGGQVYKVRDLQSRMKTLAGPVRRMRSDLYRQQDVTLTYRNGAQFERSAYYDTLSLKDLLDSWANEVDPLIIKLIEAQAVARFGVDADEQSSLHFLETLDAEGSSLLAGRKTYRMEGGLSQLTNTLYGRVAGVIPDYMLKTNHTLAEIKEDKGIFELSFKTPTGTEAYTATNIICTIPFSKLKDVHGIQDLAFSDRKKLAIQYATYATHTKGVMTFDDPFWRKKGKNTPANLGNFTGDFLTQKIWDSGRAQDGTQGLLTFQRGGKSGATAGGGVARQAWQDLTLFYTDMDSHPMQDSQMINWNQRGGSMAYFKKGDYMRFKGVAGYAEYNGRFQFAGEHTSLNFAGTLHGALETGLLAASAAST